MATYYKTKCNECGTENNVIEARSSYQDLAIDENEKCLCRTCKIFTHQKITYKEHVESGTNYAEFIPKPEGRLTGY